MPEFILDLGCDFDRWKALDSFTQGYVEAMFFTDASSDDDGDLGMATFADLADSTLAEIKAECAAFQEQYKALLDQACEQTFTAYDMQRAGNDFWYTRNSHGVGYWDRGLGEIGDSLSDVAHHEGSRYLYLGDDGKVYVD